ncbi:MAG: winged helix-turn-helix transcriptional regulator [Firmicutes bacterium]|nr:winged helix-turn-helix transcriptional regulator [Bacillota bacterium]
MPQFEDRVKIFKALADEKRLRILKLLRGGERCACVLEEQLDIPQSTLSYHMKILCNSGLVSSRQEGKWTHYKINPDGCNWAISFLEALAGPDYVTGKEFGR